MLKTLPYHKTGYFSKIACDYVVNHERLHSFFGNFSNLNGLQAQIKLKEASFLQREATRNLLVKTLKNQYKNLKISEATQENINLLAQQNTFTVTTGHQLNLFSGPLYFLYKIISAINLCEDLKKAEPNNNFVPIYWMATEDHDFEEINFFNSFEKKYQWQTNQTGAVGRFQTIGLEAVFKIFASELNTSKNADELRALFENAYLKHDNLTDATRYLANALFGEYGLVILDADDTDLKRQFSPFVEEELLSQTAFKTVSKTNERLADKGYKVRVNPRQMNLFYLKEGLRERIVFENNSYQVLNTDITFSKEAILTELQQYPERFSPNVLLRPLYQEVILPNLCYIGGGGELAYWLQLKDYFEAVKVPFPVLLLRNSVAVMDVKDAKKLEKLNVSIEELFLKQHKLIAKKVTENSELQVDFKEQKTFLIAQFETLRAVAEQTDKSFIGAVNAQENKQIKGLENLEKRWLRAEKRQQEDFVSRLTALQDKVFPKQSLEERQRNFSEHYLAYGNDFIKALKANLKPLDLEFSVLVFES